MKDKDTISKGPKRRDETCYQVLHDIVIPAGTILRNDGAGKYLADVGVGQFIVYAPAGTSTPNGFRKVVA